MPTLPNMGLITPTGHGSEDVWDTILESLFTLVDEHDHSSGKGVKVPSSGLNINADVAWNSGGTYYAITGIKALDFQPSLDSAMSAFACALYVDSDDNELYWRTAGGVNVRVTDTNSLNVGSFTGGIGGDYATTTTPPTPTGCARSFPAVSGSTRRSAWPTSCSANTTRPAT
jgi:hypothetical protein